jgi:protocatechuate 3,4-dioxygenase beta subunit
LLSLSGGDKMLHKQIINLMIFILGLGILPACGTQPVVTSVVATEPPMVETSTPEPVTATLPAPTAAVEAPTPEIILPTVTPTEAAGGESHPTDTPVPKAIACDGTLTPAQAEGPYYTPNTPKRASLIEPGMGGIPLLVTGSVLNQNCKPIAGALLDFWQTDENGDYDNVGYRMRGHQFTDENGNYALETVLPGQYPGRTPHIHVKVFSTDGQELLTSQIYFAGISDQIADGIFRADLLATNLEPDANGRQQVTFNFVVRD